MSEQRQGTKIETEREAREEAWHDQHFEGGKMPRHYDFNPTSIVYSRLLEVAGDLSGRALLEYGCGAGWSTAELRSRGAVVTAFDISTSALNETEEFLRQRDMQSGVTLLKMSAEKLEVADASFDIAFGNAILHHLNLDRAIPEMARVLKPGGLAIFAEPLGTNPAINLYRRATPQFRTPDEEPLDLTKFERKVAPWFSFRHEEFFLTALALFPLVHLPGMGGLFKFLLPKFVALDRWIFTAVPVFGHWAWYSVLVMQRRDGTGQP